MKKFSLDPNPTFRFNVAIPVPGEKVSDVVFIGRHKSKRDVNELFERGKSLSDVDLVMEITCGGELDDPFDRENVTRMVENYIGSTGAIFQTYIRELSGQREKN